MKFSRNARAHWNGGKQGRGTLTTTSTVLDNTPYSWNMRFADEKGTNPEELIGAALSGCFTMQLGVLLDKAGFISKTLDTHATVTFEDGKIPHILLDLKADVPGISDEQFHAIAQEAKETCPVSLLLNAEIELKKQLTTREEEIGGKLPPVYPI